jgi:hypothetical protein
MKPIAAFASILVAATSALAQERAAMPQPKIAGVWKLNAEKSGMRVAPGYLEIRQYAMRPDGFLVGLLIQGQPQGPFHYLQFTAKTDGKDYPEYSDPIVAEMIATGAATSRTYSETLDDEYTTDWTDKANGRVTGHGKKAVSKDGTTLTITVDGSPQVRIYDRQ